MIVLLTGVAGFIGFHAAAALLRAGARVVGIDNLNSYYDPALKQARLAQLNHPLFSFHAADIADRGAMEALVACETEVTHVLHLAAQAGVRYSMVDPYAYVHSNVLGHLAVLEAARRLPRLQHVVYASSSSVYGLSPSLPFSEADRADRPSSLYAATKRADELVSHAYAHLYDLPQTGLRFFTVYGPWGRPDMAYYAFAEAILAGRPIPLYEGDGLKRDFTYIDDIIQGVLGVLPLPPAAASPRLLNIGNHRAEPVLRLIALLERSLGRTARVERVPRPMADVMETWADIDAIRDLTGYEPATTLDEGIPRFARWFLDYRAESPLP